MAKKVNVNKMDLDEKIELACQLLESIGDDFVNANPNTSKKWLQRVVRALRKVEFE